MKDVIIKTQEFYNSLVESKKIDGTKITVDGILGEMETKPAMKALYNKYYHSEELKSLKPITGIRTNDTFTDLATDFFLIPDGDICYVVPGSTKPGTAGVYTPKWINGILGVAVMVEGLYLKMWKWKTAQNHSTLWSGAPYGHQIGSPVRYYRDGDKNNSITRLQIYSGYIGLNLHSYRNWKTGWMWQIYNKIFNVSEGCQVIPYNYYIMILPLLDKLSKAQSGYLSYNLVSI